VKIRDVRTHVLRYDLAESEVFGSSKGFRRDRQSLLVEIVTDDGLAGWGEAHGPPALAQPVVENVYKPRLLGRDPLDHGVLWHELYGPNHHAGSALSAVDVALWDLKGHALNLPVYQLLGGAQRRQVRAYATGLFHRPVADNALALAEEAAGYAAGGFRAMKMKVGFGLAEDVRCVRAVREAIGPDCLLAMDANEAYRAGDALRLAHRVADCDLAWFEEPVPREDFEGYLRLREAGIMPLAAGETEYERRGFYDLCARQAIDILQPDVGGCGGITEAWHLSYLAGLAGIAVYPHMFGTAVLLYATLQLAAALPPATAAAHGYGPLLELDRTPNPLREELARNPLQRDGDLVTIPSGPGLGLEIDRAALERYRA
jgi:D-galactarolactone cycloisomerase